MTIILAICLSLPGKNCGTETNFYKISVIKITISISEDRLNYFSIFSIENDVTKVFQKNTKRILQKNLAISITEFC